jgi:hypothetical protein
MKIHSQVSETPYTTLTAVRAIAACTRSKSGDRAQLHDIEDTQTCRMDQGDAVRLVRHTDGPNHFNYGSRAWLAREDAWRSPSLGILAAQGLDDHLFHPLTFARELLLLLTSGRVRRSFCVTVQFAWGITFPEPLLHCIRLPSFLWRTSSG